MTEGDAPPSKAKQKTYGADFLELWGVHTRGSKEKAEEEYKKAIKAKKAEHAVMLAALQVYVRTELSDRFRGHDLSRWIRDGRWEEYVGQTGGAGSADHDDDDWRGTGGGARVL